MLMGRSKRTLSVSNYFKSTDHIFQWHELHSLEELRLD